MALTYLDTAMIEQPTVFPELSVNSLQIGTVTGSTNVIGNLTVYGQVTALSGFNVIVSSTTTSSALSVTNFQAFPALNIYQAPSHPVISVFKNQTGDIVTIGDTGLTVNGTLSTSGIVAIDINSSSPALRVTQTGSGNAILVEDSVSPDSTPFVVNSGGKVGVGTTTPNELLTVTGNISATGTASVSSLNIVSGTVLPKTTFNNLVSALAINVNGTTLYMPLLSAI